MMVAASPYAAQIGAEVLERGGNAVDAAVAASFALIVVEPGMSGLGGRTVMIVGRPGGRVEGLNGATAWPESWKALRKSGRKVQPPKRWGQIAVPGTLAALAEANRKWGTRPLRELIRPSIYLARDGFLVSTVQEGLLRRAVKDLRADPLLRKTYLHPDGSPYRAGERLKQPALARTLELIAARGPQVFYRGEIARAMGTEMKRRGGYVSMRDLAAFRPRPAVIDRIRYGSYTIAAVDKPAKGRELLWRMRVLNRLPRYTDPVDRTHALAELLNEEPPKGPSRETDAAHRRRLLTLNSVTPTADRVAWRVRNRVVGLPRITGSLPVTDTTHLAVADRRGMVVSLTSSLGPYFGAKVALPNYGITFAATMGYLDDVDVSEGPVSSIAPTLVFDSAERPILAVGAAGSDRIPGVILQVLHGALDRKRSIAEAVAAPRIIVDKEAGKATALRMEPGDGMAALRAGLEARGMTVLPVPEGQVLGRVHALMRGPDGRWHGAPDPRWFGSAVAPLTLSAPTPLQSHH